MKNSNSTNSENSPDSSAAPDAGFLPWQQLKGKRIAYLTLPLLVMATIVEFVILATGWKYQQAVCLPQGMGVTFFGIGPIGATILAVELLKLPLAIWTASRVGWQKAFMLVVGLPLICVLTFQLVKDMAVYEMGTAMKPASEFLEKASAEEIKIVQLKAELDNQTKDDNAVKAVIEEKKTVRDRKLAELAAKQAKAKAEIEESLKRNDASRQDAITLTDYQKKE
jgi:Tfp pilus assembly protein PilN